MVDLMRACMAIWANGLRGMRRAALMLALILPIALVAGCGAGSRGGPIPYNVQNFGQPDPDIVQTVSADYKIAPMDTLTINVFQVKDLSGDYEVDLMGTVSMPLIGNVKAVDLTTAQLDEELTRKLGEKYMQNPDVAVQLKESTRRNVTVDGSVLQPGMYPINGPTTLMQAISLARGLAQDANPRRVAIFRQIEGKRLAAAFDLTDIRQGKETDPPVYRGDVVIVDGSASKRLQQQLLQTIPVLGIFAPITY